MPRYVVERRFPNGLEFPATQQGVDAAKTVIANNAEHGVTWVHSYVTPDKKKTFCIYDAPSPEAIRKVAGRNGLPVDQITEVRVLDPYFFL
jgi:predicted amidohydrolase YtcJ